MKRILIFIAAVMFAASSFAQYKVYRPMQSPLNINWSLVTSDTLHYFLGVDLSGNLYKSNVIDGNVNFLDTIKLGQSVDSNIIMSDYGTLTLRHSIGSSPNYGTVYIGDGSVTMNTGSVSISADESYKKISLSGRTIETRGYMLIDSSSISNHLRVGGSIRLGDNINDTIFNQALWQYSTGAGSGKVWTSDANGFGSWGTVSGFDSTHCWSNLHIHQITPCSPLTINGALSVSNRLWLNQDTIFMRGTATVPLDTIIPVNYKTATYPKIGVGTPSNTANYAIEALGTGSVAQYFQLTNTSLGTASTDGTLFGISAAGNAVINQQENLGLYLYTNNTRNASLSSTGVLRIGNQTKGVTSTTYSNLLQVYGPGAGVMIVGTNTTGSTSGSGLTFLQSDSTVMQADEGMGGLIWQGLGVASGNVIKSGAAIRAFADGTWSNTNSPAYISIYTTAASSTSITERLRIGSTVITSKIPINYGADAGSTDDYAVTIPGVTAYVTGVVYRIYCNTANTGACTLNINTLGAKSLKSLHDQDPQDSYIEAGSIVEVVYDGTNFQILSPDANP